MVWIESQRRLPEPQRVQVKERLAGWGLPIPLNTDSHGLGEVGEPGSSHDAFECLILMAPFFARRAGKRAGAREGCLHSLGDVKEGP